MPTKLDYFLDGNAQGKTEKEINGRKVTESGKPFTHWSFENRQKWFISEDDLEEFYKLYCNDLRNGIPRFLTEKSTAIGQMRVDMDFKYAGQVDEHKHTQEQVMKFVSAFMAETKKYIQVPESVEIFILEKDYPTYDRSKNISSSGIHIQIPCLKTRSSVEQAIRRTLLRRMDEFFPNLGFLKTWDDVYDKQPLTHTNNWPLLGSKKPAEGSLPYQIRYILDWDAETGEMSVDTDIPATSVEIAKKLSVRSHPDEEVEMTEYGKENVQTGAVTEREVVTANRSTSRGRQMARDQPGSRGSSPGRIYVQPLTEELRKYYEGHVKNLSSFRYSNYNDWISVGQCLKNIHPDLEDVWLDFSQQIGDSYNPREAISKWNSFTFRVDGAKLGIGSLRHWSATDNFDGFKKVEDANVDALVIRSAETQTENDVAQVIYAKYRDEFKCAKFGANEWYRYSGHIWKSTDRGVELQRRLSKDIADIYLLKEVTEATNISLIGQCEHKEPKADCECCKAEQRKKAFSNVRLKLKKTSFKRNVMEECRELFLDEALALKLDENKNLIAFNNGVFDTMGSDEKDVNGNYIRPWFRDGKPEDYISFSTNIDYNPEMKHYEHPCWPEIEAFLNSILPSRKVRDYFLKHLSTCLSGGNEAQKFHILTGSGSNGKSMLTNLMSTAMGDYCCKAPISLLTQQRNKSAAAAPELVRMKGRRFVTMQEPDEQVPLNTGLMKELASCEKITARDLYANSKAMIDFDIQARFHLACNEKPKVNSTDGGTWRRLVVIDFPMKFVAEPREKNELPIDETIVKKVVSEDWASCFINYLIHLYKEGNGHRKLTPPEEVMKYTNEYKDESDVIARFLNEYVRPVETAGDPEQQHPEPVSWNSINTTFQEWKRSNEIGHRGNVTDLKKRLEERYGKYPRSGWTAFQFGNA
jgi:P4 family phage/plasmid primase-like protien